MKFHHISIILILLTIIFYIPLPSRIPGNLTLKTFIQFKALAQGEGTQSSDSTTTIPDSASIGSNLTSQEAEEVLRLHNKARAEVGVGPLQWSRKLAIYAQEWADRLASTDCQLEHRPDSGPWKQQYGENLYMGTAGYYDAADAVEAWVAEKQLYNGEPLTFSNWNDVAHYTQIVWDDTQHVGCAAAECQGNLIVVCNYDPPGNVLGQKPY
jgi:pathogenesis-related protein 1